MKVANLLPFVANTALAALAIYVDEHDGGVAGLSYGAAYWTGPPTDDFSGDLPGWDF